MNWTIDYSIGLFNQSKVRCSFRIFIYDFFIVYSDQQFAVYQQKRLWILYFFSVVLRISVDLGFLYLQDQFYLFRWNYPHEYICQSGFCDHEQVKCYNGYRPLEKLFFWRFWIIITFVSIFLSFVDLVETACNIRKFCSSKLKSKTKGSQNRRIESNFDTSLGRNRVFSQSSNLLSEPGVIRMENGFGSQPKVAQF